MSRRIEREDQTMGPATENCEGDAGARFPLTSVVLNETARPRTIATTRPLYREHGDEPAIGLREIRSNDKGPPTTRATSTVFSQRGRPARRQPRSPRPLPQVAGFAFVRLSGGQVYHAAAPNPVQRDPPITPLGALRKSSLHTVDAFATRLATARPRAYSASKRSPLASADTAPHPA